MFTCFLFSFLLFFIAKKINSNRFCLAKVSPYECGFEAFSDARAQLTIHFYLIALLFVLFDVEVIYFLPWATNFYFLGTQGYTAMCVFTFFLILGFYYEWVRGVFD